MGVIEIERELAALSVKEFKERVSPILHTKEGTKLIRYGHTINLTAKEKSRLEAAILAAGFTTVKDRPETFVFYAMSQLATNANL